MRPGRELDTYIAKEVLGHAVKVKQKELWEVTEKGERPLRKYSRDMSAAWEVVEKLNVVLIPIEDQSWFAFVGQKERWKSPAEFMEFLSKGDFANSGAAVGQDPAETVCFAAVKSIEKKNLKAQQPVEETAPATLNS